MYKPRGCGILISISHDYLPISRLWWEAFPSWEKLNNKPVPPAAHKLKTLPDVSFFYLRVKPLKKGCKNTGDTDELPIRQYSSPTNVVQRVFWFDGSHEPLSHRVARIDRYRQLVYKRRWAASAGLESSCKFLFIAHNWKKERNFSVLENDDDTGAGMTQKEELGETRWAQFIAWGTLFRPVWELCCW